MSYTSYQVDIKRNVWIFSIWIDINLLKKRVLCFSGILYIVRIYGNLQSILTTRNSCSMEERIYPKKRYSLIAWLFFTQFSERLVLWIVLKSIVLVIFHCFSEFSKRDNINILILLKKLILVINRMIQQTEFFVKLLGRYFTRTND